MLSPNPVVFIAGVYAAQDAVPPIQTVRLSAWSVSGAKRLFDLVVVCALGPLVFPLLLMVAAAVRLSSPGPAIFRQTRIGSHGRPFTILKFRTMFERASDKEAGIACLSGDRITDLGRILRKLKLDELPQVLNVLRGDMSLVGPRPRIAGQQLDTFACRPGITGAATLAFAREDLLLVQLPQERVAQYYRDHIMPEKHRLDRDYLSRATVVSDVQILFRTVLGCWYAPCVRQPGGLRAVHSVSQSEAICSSDPA